MGLERSAAGASGGRATVPLRHRRPAAGLHRGPLPADSQPGAVWLGGLRRPAVARVPGGHGFGTLASPWTKAQCHKSRPCVLNVGVCLLGVEKCFFKTSREGRTFDVCGCTHKLRTQGAHDTKELINFDIYYIPHVSIIRLCNMEGMIGSSMFSENPKDGFINIFSFVMTDMGSLVAWGLEAEWQTTSRSPLA